jgi:hypothetical protein
MLAKRLEPRNDSKEDGEDLDSGDRSRSKRPSNRGYTPRVEPPVGTRPVSGAQPGDSCYKCGGFGHYARECPVRGAPYRPFFSHNGGGGGGGGGNFSGSGNFNGGGNNGGGGAGGIGNTA